MPGDFASRKVVPHPLGVAPELHVAAASAKYWLVIVVSFPERVLKGRVYPELDWFQSDRSCCMTKLGAKMKAQEAPMRTGKAAVGF